MSEHRVTVVWRRTRDDFSYEGYDRTHTWAFDGGLSIDASAAPEYRGDAALPNPEEAFAAALSSCHMLTFLAIAARKRLVVDRYEDHAVARLEKNEDGRLAVTHVTLHPRIRFAAGSEPDAATLESLHEAAHRNCFIANSVRTEVQIV